KAGLFRLNLYARVRLLLCVWHTRPRVQSAPGFPCALWFEGEEGTCITRAKSRREIAKSYSLPTSSLRKQGPIRRGGSYLKRWSTALLQQLLTVVMGPCVRRDDGSVERHALTIYTASPRANCAAFRYAKMFASYDSIVPPLNTAEPATKALAPAAANSPDTSGPTPPSTSISIGRPAVIARISRILPSAEGINAWPPKPGLTDMTSTRSIRSMTYSIALAGVPGLSETPAFLPSARIACSERCRCGPASACTVMWSQPALAK